MTAYRLVPRGLRVVVQDGTRRRVLGWEDPCIPEPHYHRRTVTHADGTHDYVAVDLDDTFLACERDSA